MNLGLNEFVLIVGVTLFLAFIPRILDKVGVFVWLGKSSWGSKVSSFFGSKEPTDFVRGMFVVLFCVTLSFFIFSGVTTQAIQYQIHEPAIKAFEFCNTSFYAQQQSFGVWAIECTGSSSVNPIIGNLSLPSSLYSK